MVSRGYSVLVGAVFGDIIVVMGLIMAYPNL
jgi:hypothetical protein